MRKVALKYGHDGVVCIDATYSTSHMKFSLYTALVVDTHGNGLPIFEVLSESNTQPAMTEWMMHRVKSMPSGDSRSPVK